MDKYELDTNVRELLSELIDQAVEASEMSKVEEETSEKTMAAHAEEVDEEGVKVNNNNDPYESRSPPSDLSRSLDHRDSADRIDSPTINKANMEFFSDIFDIVPTQCYMSQRESQIPPSQATMTKEFLSPLPPQSSTMAFVPKTPIRSQSIAFTQSPMRFQWEQSQDMYQSPPRPSKYNDVGPPVGPRTPDLGKYSPMFAMPTTSTPKRYPIKYAQPAISTTTKYPAPGFGLSQSPSVRASVPSQYPVASLNPNQTLIMASPAATPRFNDYRQNQVSHQKFVVPPSPGADMIARLSDLLPKRKRVNEPQSSNDSAMFKRPEQPKPRPPTSSRYELLRSEDSSRSRSPLRTHSTKNDNQPPWTMVNYGKPMAVQISKKPEPRAEKSESMTSRDFCPPYMVGAYSTAPMSHRASRAIRIGLSRRGKRSHSIDVASTARTFNDLDEE